MAKQTDGTSSLPYKLHMQVGSLHTNVQECIGIFNWLSNVWDIHRRCGTSSGDVWYWVTRMRCICFYMRNLQAAEAQAKAAREQMIPSIIALARHVLNR